MADLSAFTVSEYMTTNLLTFKPDTDVMSAIGALVKQGHSGAPDRSKPPGPLHAVLFG